MYLRRAARHQETGMTALMARCRLQATLIASVEIEIGGQIDKHYGEWLHI
jgi:hypothetical protein